MGNELRITLIGAITAEYGPYFRLGTKDRWCQVNLKNTDLEQTEYELLKMVEWLQIQPLTDDERDSLISVCLHAKRFYQIRRENSEQLETEGRETGI